MGKNIKDGIRRFDFEKKPIRPTFIMNLAKWIISWPDLKKRKFVLTKTNMENVKSPYLLLVTHSSMVDFNISKPFTLVRSAMDLESMHIEYDYLGRGDCVDISIPDDSFWCYLSKRDAITKISFATEEMHKLAKFSAV